MSMRILIFTTLFVAVFGPSAQACCLPVLLDIEINRCDGTVTFTSTGADSAINDCSSTEADGVDLRKFFTSSVETSDPNFCGTLTPSGGDLAYNSAYPDDARACSSFVDLNLYSDACWADCETQDFSECSPAFTGSATIDLSEFECELPCVGSTGHILAGNSEDGSDCTIGVWEVVAVPEPSQYGFLVSLVVIALVLKRRLLVGSQD